MSETVPTRVCISRLILIPALITLAVTILRLVGELQHWPTILFNPAAGGGGAIVGISWLPFIFGPYFAVKLYRAGGGPVSVGKAFGFTILSLVFFFVASFVGFAAQITPVGRQALGYVLMAASVVPVYLAWPALTKTLLAYGYAARIPVAIIMFFALRGSWGTHYDAPPPGYPPDVAFWPKYFEIAFLPQLILWIVFTIIAGALFGSVAAAIVRRRRPEPPTSG